MKKLALSSLLVLLTLTAVSCSKQEQESSPVADGGGILGSELVRQIPDSTLGLAVWSLDNPGYERYAKSAWSTGSSGLSDTLTSQATESKDLAALLSVLGKTGLLDRATDGKEPLREGVLFAGLGSGSQPVDVGLYARASDEASLTQLIAKFKAALDAEQIKNEPRDYKGGKGLVVTLSQPAAASATGDADQQPTLIPVYVGQNAMKLAIASTPSLVDRLFEPVPATGPAILQTANFKEASKLSPITVDTFTYGYVDMGQVAEKFGSLAAAAGQSPDFFPTDLPITSVAFSREMGTELRDRIVAPWNPTRSALWNDRVAKLGENGKNPLIERAPGETLFFLGIDGTVAKNVLEMSGGAAGAGPDEAKWITMAGSVKHFGLGLRGAQGAAPFPDVFLVFQSGQAPQIQTELKSALSVAAASQGMPTAPWKTAQERGASYEYIMTPLGVGVFVGNRDGNLVLASSQGALLDMIGDPTGTAAPTLKASVSDSSRAVIADQPSTIVSYLNFERSAQMVEGLMGSLAMFTGGADPVNKEQIEYIRSLGQASSRVSFDQDGMKLQAVYEQGKKAS